MANPPNTNAHSSKEPSFDFINQLAIRLLRRNTLSDLCWEIVEAIGALPDFSDMVLYLKHNRVLVQVAAIGPKRGTNRQIVNPIQIPIGEGIVGSIANSARAELIHDTQQDPRYIRDEFAGRSELAVPVIYQDTVIAVLDTEHKSVGGYTVEHMQLLQSIANISASRIASAIVEEENRIVSDQLAELNQQLERRVLQRTRELSDARDFIQKERDRTFAVLNSLQNGLLVVTSDFRIDLLSRSARELTGWDQCDAVGCFVDEVFQLQGVPDLPARLQKLDGPVAEQDAVLLCNDGTRRDIRWNVTPVHQGDAKPKEFAIIFYDVTQEKYLARRTENYDRIQSLGILAGGIAHDFNNNLTAIQASIDCITLPENANEVNALEIAQQACRQAKQLTQQLLTFSKGGVPVRKPSDIAEVLRTSAALATSGRRISIDWQLSKDLPAVMVDAGQMIQVFNNIFLNSIQASEGRSNARMTVFAEATVQISEAMSTEKLNSIPNQPMVQVVITDDGPGFDPEILNRVFEPYFTASENGTGLGLTSSFFIVRNHNGDIMAANAKDGGAEITVQIPAIADDNKESNVAVSNTSGHRYRVLLLDDEDLVRDSISMLLKSLGHEVVTARHGDEALVKIRQETDRGNRCQIALLDLTIRNGRGGDEIVEELKLLLPDIVCVVVSGYSDRPAMATPQKFGFHAVLSKPFSRDELRNTLDDAVAGFRT